MNLEELEDLEPWQRLFVAVIVRARWDLHHRNERKRTAALQWITDPDSTLNTYAAALGLAPRWVRARALGLYVVENDAERVDMKSLGFKGRTARGRTGKTIKPGRN